ncbi:alpha/beta hydrolase [Rasiella sp. SM2506]|uniref:alpha/beta hydrolase n=1 Tax=Rasiella sp. SM2506 TaxID=3423914 RepID=UPI003D795130
MKNFLKFLLAILIICSLTIGGLYLFQEKFIFLPKDLDQDYTYNFPSLATNVTFEELFIDTQDGARLNALYFKVDTPKGLVVYFHGNAHNLSKWGAIASQFTQHNFNVIMLDYRGYGKSTGKRSELAMYQDALVFYKKANELFPESQTTVYGRSLGATFATYVASKNKPRKLILESPFYSLTDVLKIRYPYLPAEKLLKYNFNTGDFVNGVTSRVTIIHGTEDGVVPFKSGEKLFKVFPEDFRKMIQIKGGKHNDLATFPEFAIGLYGELSY